MFFSLFKTLLQAPRASCMLEQSPLPSARDVCPKTSCVESGRGVSSFVAIFARLSDVFVFLFVGRVDGMFDHLALLTS